MSNIGQKLLETMEISYTTTNVDTSTMTTLGTLSQEMDFIHVYDTSGSAGQILDGEGTVLLNYPQGGLTTREPLRVDKDEDLYVKAVNQTMTSGYLVVSIFGGG